MDLQLAVQIQQWQRPLDSCATCPEAHQKCLSAKQPASLRAALPCFCCVCCVCCVHCVGCVCCVCSLYFFWCVLFFLHLQHAAFVVMFWSSVNLRVCVCVCVSLCVSVCVSVCALLHVCSSGICCRCCYCCCCCQA